MLLNGKSLLCQTDSRDALVKSKLKLIQFPFPKCDNEYAPTFKFVNTPNRGKRVPSSHKRYYNLMVAPKNKLLSSSIIAKSVSFSTINVC